MTTTRFEEIQEKLESLKQKKARAEGALEKINSQLKKDFDVTTEKEAAALLKKLDVDIAANETRRDELEKELEALVDWDAL